MGESRAPCVDVVGVARSPIEPVDWRSTMRALVGSERELRDAAYDSQHSDRR